MSHIEVTKCARRILFIETLLQFIKAFVYSAMCAMFS
jgi:hypothetical protein